MSSTKDPSQPTTAAHPAPAPIFASLELSRSRWLVTVMMPGGDKMSKYSVPGGDGGALLGLLSRLRARAERHATPPVGIVTIQEAGFDGFWIHRLLQANGIESHVVEPASIAVPRRHRRAKTDAIDGEALLRTLMAFKRGEPRVCSMVVPPSPEAEDRRRVSRERRTLIKERIGHINRIKGLLATQGIAGYEPMRQNRRERLEELRTGDGRPLPPRLKAEIGRELERLELLRRQIAAVEAERGALVQEEAPAQTPAGLLMRLRGIGPEFAAVLWLEGLFRRFENRRQLAAYAGLAPSPWQSGTVKGEQGISKSGNPRLRTTAIELAWLWLRHQPETALSRWFRERVRSDRGRVRRVSIVALARKLLIALWRFVTDGVVPEGATIKAA
jgi:transposase